MTEDERQIVQDFLDVLDQHKVDLIRFREPLPAALSSALNDPFMGPIVVNTVVGFEQSRQSLLPATLVSVGNEQQPPQARPQLESSASKASSDTRDHSDPYDYLVLAGAKHGATLCGKPVGIPELFKLAVAYDPKTRREAFRSKLHRSKKTKGELAWEKSKNITITPVGEKNMSELRTYISSQEMADLEQAFITAWGKAPQQN